VKQDQVVRIEDDIKDESVFHPVSFIYFSFQKIKSLEPRLISVHVNREVIFPDDDFTFRFYFFLTISDKKNKLK